jgi:hypothetical protein
MLHQFMEICYNFFDSRRYGLISSLYLVANSINYGGQER